MTKETTRRAVQTELEIRVTIPSEPGKLTRILKILWQTGGPLHAHLIYRLENEMVGLFVCQRPAEAALALEQEGFTVETETVVTVQTENRSGAMGHLVHSLEVENTGIGYSYASASAGSLYVVFSTDDNPRAEDILLNFLRLEGRQDPAGPP